MTCFGRLRVLDLADESGMFCGTLFAALGAQVIRIEPSTGDPTRDIGPFLRGRRDRNASLFFQWYHGAKQLVTLDIEAPHEQSRWQRECEVADILVVSGSPAECARRGLDAATLQQRNPRLVVVAIAPFGQSGPRVNWRSCDLVAQALGGMAFVNGHPQDAPLRGFGLQAYHSAGVHAAIGALLALLVRERSGRGQFVDISTQEAVAATVEHVSGSYHLNGTIEQRRGSLHWTRAFRVGRARDGYVMQTTLGDWPSLVEWVKSEMDPCGLDDPQYEAYAARQRDHQHIFDVLDRWIRDHDAEELIESAQLRRIPFAAVRPLTAVASDPQLRARGFFADERPGPPFRLKSRASDEPDSAAQCPSVGAGRVPAGRVERGAASPGDAGGHNDLRYIRNRDAVGDGAQSPAAEGRALTGIRVLDFTWVVAGPVATRVLADHGADVIKIERRDATDFGSRRAGLTGNLNRGKRSIVINMAEARGIALARDLVRRCDVVVDNFSSRVMRNWGLDYDHLRALKPDIIAVSMSGFGHSGPNADHVSYGPTLQALTGFSLQMRHAHGEPAGWGYSYSDMIAGYCGALAVVSALWQRAHTGMGQWIDLSQLEALAAMIGVPLLEVLANGQLTAPFGNRSMERAAAPHGIYRCRDRDNDGAVRDRWCALAVFGDGDWQRFVAALNAPTWTGDPRFASADARQEHQDALDAYVEDWTRARTAEEVMVRLQEAGIAAGIVANGRDLSERDPQLAARRYWRTLPTPEGETVTVDGPAVQLSATPGDVDRVAPLLGEDTDRVLHELLGLDPTSVERLRQERVIG